MVKMTEAVVKATSGYGETHWAGTIAQNILEVAERLQDIGIQALTVHGRTRVQMYKGAADWFDWKIKGKPGYLIFGNGDINLQGMGV